MPIIKYYSSTDDSPTGGNSSISKSILDWMKYGSNIEDATITRLDEKLARYRNHFYDPINNTGLDCKTCGIHVTGLPAPNWALEQSESGVNQTISGQNYSLLDAKAYYLAALTSSTKTERDNNLALAFKTLGHVLHTVEDMAQPQHTRNDAHGGVFDLFGPKSLYERYVDEEVGSITMAGYLPPVFDSYRKFYTSVDADGVMGDGTGLADFSNRSFVTAGTNFACLKENVINGCDGAISEGSYPNPIFSRDMKTEIPANQLEGVNPEFTDPVTFFGNVITDAYTKKEFINNLMTTYSIFDEDLKEKNKSPAFTLNRFNYFEMAGILIPRAVGYSAGLLNHFFRGDIDLQEDAGSGYVIVNNTEEDMNGIFNIYYDNKDNERILLWSSEDKLLLEKSSTGNNKSPNIQLTEPEPSKALKPGRYILVFEGSLGGENTVVGKVVRTPTDPYIMIMPVNHETREILSKEFYFFKAKTNTLTSVSNLPFTLLDDSTDRGFRVPLGTGGPQYIAKYWEEGTQRVRYVPNLSYEKEAYLSFHLIPTDSGGMIKDINSASGVPRVDYLTYEPVDDITGYHLDRIFISDTFDGSYVLVAFDEYAYNNGSGLVHDMKYEPSDSDATKHILYYDIPKTEVQNADHEAIRTGRKLLLFKGDGTLKQELQDPIGLDKTIGSIGILN